VKSFVIPKILVAGGAGFIGSALVRVLVEDGLRVAVLDDFSSGSRENLNEVAERIEILACDAAENSALSAALMRVQPTHVVSCIGDTYVPAAYAFPDRFFRNNVTANLNLLQACRQPGIARFVYLSSAEVYGDQPLVRLDERATLGAVNTYAVSKLAADQLTLTQAAEHGVPAVVARMFNCYGPRETHAYVVPEIIDQLQRSSALVIGNSQAVRDLTYVEDTARALHGLMFADIPSGTVVNVGSGDAVSVADLARTIGRLMGHEAISVTTASGKLRRREMSGIRCDNGLLRRLTGWSPSVTLEEGLGRTIAWFRSNGGRWPWRSHDEEAGMRTEIEPLPRLQIG
jgi:nucleoside-diphosphate-sugar epimerase